MSEELLSKIAEFPVIPVFYHDDVETTVNVVNACYTGGMRVFEFTNRGENSEAIFKELIQESEKFPGMVFGTGTIMNRDQAEVFLGLGAEFIVSPIMDPEVASLCGTENKPWVPGCGTLTEVISATRLGAELVKVFPGNVLGPQFIKSCLGPCPHLKLMPTGGVKPTQENLSGWFNAGVFSVGIGSSLFDSESIKPENFQKLVDKISQVKTMVNSFSN
ncbi:MAG: bifunctional 4-hydroxy-2-oxoglutarate aldolase/2-dehydro-3-deoxy-phosphogluconate aldolase [Balneola sp.]|nr:MAG: bifunctional 4-hydroxy-2-oxoglutarate aldolase/2-dehydro-3-deoxy-phosphogluconate aldolase [Balneola sp.]